MSHYADDIDVRNQYRWQGEQAEKKRAAERAELLQQAEATRAERDALQHEVNSLRFQLDAALDRAREAESGHALQQPLHSSRHLDDGTRRHPAEERLRELVETYLQENT